MLCRPRKLALLPLGHLIERNVQPRTPEVGTQACLVLERGEKFPRLGERFPDLRQECGPMLVELEGDAVDAGAKTRAQLVLGVETRALQRRKQRDFHPRRLEFVRGQRRKARITECRGERILAYVEPDVPRRPEAADATAQLSPVKQRDERRPGPLQRSALGTAVCESQLGGDRSPRDADQGAAELVIAHRQSPRAPPRLRSAAAPA